MRYSLLPDPARLNPGFMKQDRVYGVGQPTDTPATPTPAGAPTFWGSLGTTFVDLTRTFAPGLISWGITGNAPQPVVTQSGNVAVIPGGTRTVASATGANEMPTWLVPALIGGAVLLFFVAKKK